MPALPSTSVTLMARIAGTSRKDEVWAEFVSVSGRHILDWSLGYGLAEPDALDLCQDVLVRFWRQASQFQYDPAKRFRSYLRCITEGALSDWKAGLAIGVEGQGGSTVLKVLRTVPAKEDLIARLERAFDSELVDRALLEVQTRVEPHTYQAFQLLAVQRLSGREVAELLGMTVEYAYVARNTVQRMIKDIIRRLEQNALQV